jgi:hypothetical protein
MPRSTRISRPSSATPIEKPINPVTAQAWPPGSRRVYRIGVLLWVLVLQLLVLIADFVLPSAWWAWHLFALLGGLLIGHLMTMRILAAAIQEWKNRV